MSDRPTQKAIIEWLTGEKLDPRQETGWWGMACWNALSHEQQRMLIERGVLELGFHPEGECPNRAVLMIECEDDEAPGPRFYCRPCAIKYLEEKCP